MQKNTRCDENKYLLSNVVPVSSDTSDSHKEIIVIESSDTEHAKNMGGGKKRGRDVHSPVVTGSSQPSKKKKGKGTVQDATGEAGLSPLTDSFIPKELSTSQKFKEQKIRTEGLTCPVDQRCPLESTHHVYIDEDRAVYDVSLNQTNIGGNNNKFYRIQVRP